MSNIVYLPGTSGHGSFWDPVAEHVRAEHQLTLDWPGLGGNPADPAVRSIDELQEMVVNTIAEPSVLVGQSMGGYVAARIALARPDLVTHLVLAVTSAGIDRAALGLPAWAPSLGPGDSDDVEWVTAPHAPLDDQVATLKMPVLLIWASRDEISPLPIGQRLNQLIPQSKLVTFDTDDHWVARVQARAVAAEINTLLSNGQAT